MTQPEAPGDSAAAAAGQAAQFALAMESAMGWRRRTGWPGRGHDLKLAAQLLIELRGPTQPDWIFARWHAELAYRLGEALRCRYQDATVNHRCLLCLLLTNALSRSSDLRPVYLRLFTGPLP